LLAELTSEQVSEWEAYSKLEPFSNWRMDYYSAQICALVMNIARSIYSKKGSNPKLVTTDNFMLQNKIDDMFDKMEMTDADVIKQPIEDMRKVLLDIFKFAKKSGKAKIKGRLPEDRRMKPPKNRKAKIKENKDV
jgi:hypothetical protein